MTDLGERARNAADKAWAKTPGVHTLLTYHLYQERDDYDPETGEPHDPAHALRVDAIVVSHDTDMVRGLAVEPNDRRVLIRIRELEQKATALGATFAENEADWLQVDADKWRIRSMERDPARAILDLHVAAPE